MKRCLWESSCEKAAQEDSPFHESLDPNDIGLCHGKTELLKDIDKYDLLRTSWKPEENSAIPFCQEGSKRRKFVYHWLTTYQWLAHSKAIDGCFYLPCMLFGFRSAIIQQSK